ncbi:MAG: hypothetical protein IH903_09935 [Proteobacteria bacterium]|nr:hypothetical protein [Pseudomonadota bacterium]
MMTAVKVEISPGELIDRITILEIKAARITDEAKRANVRVELGELTAARQGAVAASARLAALTGELKEVNEALWDIEDEIRALEAAMDFGPAFIELARAVYKTNDRRSAIKRKINELLGSRLIDEKSYTPY